MEKRKRQRLGILDKKGTKKVQKKANPIYEPSFVTGFHFHPYHSIDYLHMHVICTNVNMVNKSNFKVQTNAKKFISTQNLMVKLSTHRNWANVLNKSEVNKNTVNKVRDQISRFVKVNAASLKDSKVIYNDLKNDHINKYMRKDATIFHMDKKCIVFSNNDVPYKKRKVIEGEEKLVQGGSTSKVHLLVIPWKPVYNCVALKEKDIALVGHMEKMGKMVGEELTRTYINIGEDVAKREFGGSFNQPYTVFKNFEKGKADYEKIVKLEAESNRGKRIHRLRNMKENREIQRENFHYFTQFSKDKNGRFNKMQKFRSL